MKGKFVCLTQHQANEILDILNDCVVDEECFASQVGKENCRHCQIDRTAGYLFDGGMIERKYVEKNSTCNCDVSDGGHSCKCCDS